MLTELSEVMNPEQLLSVAKKGIELTLVQRLGFVLELLGKKKLTGPSEEEPPQKMRLKIEINTREHFSVCPLEQKIFQIQNSWFSGEAY